MLNLTLPLSVVNPVNKSYTAAPPASGQSQAEVSPKGFAKLFGRVGNPEAPDSPERTTEAARSVGSVEGGAGKVAGGGDEAQPILTKPDPRTADVHPDAGYPPDTKPPVRFPPARLPPVRLPPAGMPPARMPPVPAEDGQTRPTADDSTLPSTGRVTGLLPGGTDSGTGLVDAALGAAASATAATLQAAWGGSASRVDPSDAEPATAAGDLAVAGLGLPGGSATTAGPDASFNGGLDMASRRGGLAGRAQPQPPTAVDFGQTGDAARLAKAADPRRVGASAAGAGAGAGGQGIADVAGVAGPATAATVASGSASGATSRSGLGSTHEADRATMLQALLRSSPSAAAPQAVAQEGGSAADVASGEKTASGASANIRAPKVAVGEPKIAATTADKRAGHVLNPAEPDISQRAAGTSGSSAAGGGRAGGAGLEPNAAAPSNSSPASGSAAIAAAALASIGGSAARDGIAGRNDALSGNNANNGNNGALGSLPGGLPAGSALAWMTAAAAANATPAAATDGRIAASPGSSEFAPQLAAQISTFVRDGLHHALLELNPAEMGPLTVQIQLDGNAARVHLAAEHAGTRLALEQAMPQLAGSLRENGLTLSGGGVFEQPRQQQAQASDYRSSDNANANANANANGNGNGNGNDRGADDNPRDPRRSGSPDATTLAMQGASAGRRRGGGVVDLVA